MDIFYWITIVVLWGCIIANLKCAYNNRKMQKDYRQELFKIRGREDRVQKLMEFYVVKCQEKDIAIPEDWWGNEGDDGSNIL